MSWRRGQAYAQDLRERVLAATSLTLRQAAARSRKGHAGYPKADDPTIAAPRRLPPRVEERSCLQLSVLGCGAHNEAADLDIVWLLDRESHRARDRIGRNGELPLALLDPCPHAWVGD